MGTLAVIVNHTRKEYFYPDVCKWNEVMLNPYVMYGILDYLWNCNRCEIEFTNEYSIDKLRDDYKYKEIELDWKEIHSYYEEEKNTP